MFKKRIDLWISIQNAKNMNNLVLLTISLLFANTLQAQSWSSSFIGKPESRALYASNVARAIQNAWENELLRKDKTEMLLDEIIFGQDSEPKETMVVDISRTITSNIDEIEEGLGIYEDIVIDPVKKKKLEVANTLPSEKIITTSGTQLDAVTDKRDETREISEVGMSQINGYPKRVPLIISDEEIETDSVYSLPQVSPVFPGGQNAMKSFFANNIIPPESDGKSVNGKVFVRFMVKKNGELAKIYLVKGLNDACNKEAIRVVKKMPRWIPARQEGEIINAWHTLPIYFEID